MYKKQFRQQLINCVVHKMVRLIDKRDKLDKRGASFQQ